MNFLIVFLGRHFAHKTGTLSQSTIWIFPVGKRNAAWWMKSLGTWMEITWDLGPTCSDFHHKKHYTVDWFSRSTNPRDIIVDGMLLEKNHSEGRWMITMQTLLPELMWKDSYCLLIHLDMPFGCQVREQVCEIWDIQFYISCLLQKKGRAVKTCLTHKMYMYMSTTM